MAELAKVAASSEVDLEDLAAKSADVQRLITSKNPVKALARALENPPTASKDAAVKCAAAEVVFRALEANADIAAAVEGVAAAGPGCLDILLKYVYLGLATPRPPLHEDAAAAEQDATLLEQKKWSGALLKWHPAVVEKTGPGGIIRVMVDRKTVG